MQSFQSIRSELQREAGKPSANFQRPGFTDRFRQPLASAPAAGAGAGGPDGASTSAPGAGNVAGFGRAMTSPLVRINSPPPGVGAPFKSNSAGHAAYDLELATRAPGPAYYGSPGLPPKRSFHLNARKRFVSQGAKG